MEIFTLTTKAVPKIVILLPENVCNQDNAQFLLSKIIQPVGLDIKDIAFAGAYMPEKGKVKKADFVAESELLLEYMSINGINNLMVGQPDYYYFITKNKQLTLNVGNLIPGVAEFDHISVLPLINPAILQMFPQRAKEVNRCLSVARDVINGTYKEKSTNLELEFNEIYVDPKIALAKLKEWFEEPELFVDIETTGLRWYADDLLTISFARNDKEAFCIAIHKKYHSEDTYKEFIKILKSFFNQFKGHLVGHNWIGFDQAFVTHEIMRGKNFDVPQYDIINKFKLDDSMLLAHILYNSTEKQSIGLKELVFSKMGKYDKDIDQKDLFNAPLKKVALYNNYDVIATYKVWKGLLKELEESPELKKVYAEFVEIGTSLLKLKMNGLRVAKKDITVATKELDSIVKDIEAKFLDNQMVRDAALLIAKEKFLKYNKTLKNKKVWEEERDKFYEPFNASSPNQKRILFFDVMDLPGITKSKTTNQWSTDADTLEEWRNSGLPEHKLEAINLISALQAASKVNSTYLKVFESSSIETSEDHWKIFANFNQTGTISGRLSSSGGINFQNLPAKSTYGALVKKLLIPDDGFILAAVDFSALEERLIAIEAMDMTKLRVFTDGIDSHSLNAYAYFKDKLEDRDIIIDVNDASSINRIKTEAKDLRDIGKSITFGMNYGSGPTKIASQLSIPLQEAQEIFDSYWELYSATKRFNNEVIKETKRTGYVVSDFSGLRLKVASINAENTFIRSKEERRAANFKTQSGNFLTLRGLHEFQLLIEKENYIEDVKICNTVHDSIKLQIRNDAKIIQWANTNLTSILCRDYKPNQPLKLEAELDIGFNEKDMVTLKNDASIKDIEEAFKNLKEMKENK